MQHTFTSKIILGLPLTVIVLTLLITVQQRPGHNSGPISTDYGQPSRADIRFMPSGSMEKDLTLKVATGVRLLVKRFRQG
jgi:hypothetical protein